MMMKEFHNFCFSCVEIQQLELSHTRTVPDGDHRLVVMVLVAAQLTVIVRHHVKHVK